MNGWTDFFAAQVGASAALAGLVFVGVSINLTRIMSFPPLIEGALSALVALLTVLIVSSLLLVPGQPAALEGAEVLVVGLIGWLPATVFAVRDLRRRSVPLRYTLLGAGLGQAGALPFVIAGAAMLVRADKGIYWLVPGIIFSFVSAMLNAWVLLVEINR